MVKIPCMEDNKDKIEISKSYSTKECRIAMIRHGIEKDPVIYLDEYGVKKAIKALKKFLPSKIETADLNLTLPALPALAGNKPTLGVEVVGHLPRGEDQYIVATINGAPLDIGRVDRLISVLKSISRDAKRNRK